MALKALMLKKKIDDKRKELAEIEKQMEAFDLREAEIAKSIEEAISEEEKKVVEEAIDAFDTEKAKAEEDKANIEKEVAELEGQLEEEEKEQDVEPKEEPKEEERKETKKMEIRNLDNAFVQREDVQAYLMEVRSAIKEKRALTNVGLTIPEVFLGLLRENIGNYSKLYKHLNVRRINGTGRQVYMSQYPEAVWTDCCANLNELSLTFYQDEYDCWKVGGYFVLCNANLEDSDLNLAQELMIAIGQAIGLALDKAVLYGTGTRMPLGAVTRLVQEEAPADYPATARPWVDLHTTNIKTIAASKTGADLIAALALDFGAAKGSYSRGEKVWCMNESTYTQLVAACVSVDAAGAIVSGVNGVMPVIGGVIEVLNFIPDNVIVAGYFDLYTLAERAGQQFATSEHVRFLQDQTVIKGTARYDGKPSIAEGFVAIGLNGVTPDADVDFVPAGA